MITWIVTYMSSGLRQKEVTCDLFNLAQELCNKSIDMYSVISVVRKPRND